MMEARGSDGGIVTESNATQPPASPGTTSGKVADPFDAMPPGPTILRRFLTGLAVMMCSLSLIGFAITDLGVLRGVRNWDESINDALADSRSNWASDLGEHVTAIGDTGAILLLNAIVLIVLASLRKWRAMTFVPMALLAEITTFLAVNVLIGRPRPDVVRLGPLPGTDSYPSGHIAATFVCWMSVAVLLHLYGRMVWSRLIGVVGVTLTIAMGWARIYVGMHHFLDVVLGLAMGVAAWLLGIHALGQWSRAFGRADNPSVGSAPPKETTRHGRVGDE